MLARLPVALLLCGMVFGFGCYRVVRASWRSLRLTMRYGVDEAGRRMEW